MKKFLLIILSLLGIGFSAAAQEVKPLHAYMTNSDNWGSGTTWSAQYGFYKITPGGEENLVRETSNTIDGFSKDVSHGCGGCFYGGNVYYVLPSAVKSFLNSYTGSLICFNPATGESQTVASGSKNGLTATDMTFDYRSGAAYSIAPRDILSTNPEMPTILRKVSLADGTCTEVATIQKRLITLAADADGVLWGTGYEFNGRTTCLYKIDKATGEILSTVETDIPVYTGTTCTATFDLRTGKFYLLAKTSTDDGYGGASFASALYSLDLATGQGAVEMPLTGGAEFVCLYMEDCHPDAPQQAQDLSFSAASKGGTDGNLIFTVPMKTYAGGSLSGTVEAHILVDGTEIAVQTVQAGVRCVYQGLSLGEGSVHTIRVVLEAGGLASLPTEVEVYAGMDQTPAAVSDLTCTPRDNYATAALTWTAPTVGANGGEIDAEALRYRVVRKPDNLTVAEGIAETHFDDAITREMGVTQYEVTALLGENASESRYTEIMSLGAPHECPYLEPFDLNSHFMSYTVIDANGDADSETGGTWYFDPSNYLAFYYTNFSPADDWLITPTIALSTAKTYRLQFQISGYMGGYENHLTVTAGSEPTAESQTHVLMDETMTTSAYMQTAYTIFRPESTDCRIGFHNTSTYGDHMLIDNILVEEYGSVNIPQAPSDLTGTYVRGDGVTLSFILPRLTVDGAKLEDGDLTEVKIYRAGNSTPLATIAAGAPGEAMQWKHSSPAAGVNHYLVVACSNEGDGLEAEVRVDTNPDVPQAVCDLAVVGIDGQTAAQISWTQDLTGVEGKALSADDISYSISRVVGVVSTKIADNVTGTEYIDRDLASVLSRQQEYVAYTVTPSTNGGTGESRTSDAALLGKAYSLPFTETWTEQVTDCYPWRSTTTAGGGYWTVAASGYDPYTSGFDGTGLASFRTSSQNPTGSAVYTSPRTDFASFSNPRVSFYVYHSADSECAGAKLTLGCAIDGEEVSIFSDEIGIYSTTAGWKQYTFAIPARFAAMDRVSLVFCGKTSSEKGCIHIDKVEVSGTQPSVEVKAVALSGPDDVVIGADNVFSFTCENVGSRSVTNVAVRLFADGTEVATGSIPSLAAGAQGEVSLTYRPSPATHEGTRTLQAVLSASGDASADNNTATKTVCLLAPMLPVVADLKAVAAGADGIQLSWTDNTVYTRVETVLDDCEALEAFAIDGFGGWTTFDADGAKTTGVSLDGYTYLEWNHAQEAQAFIVYNTEQAGTSAYIPVRSGSQCLISFESTATNGNDDWLVSPRLSGDAHQVSFYAKCLYPTMLDERFELWTSTLSSLSSVSTSNVQAAFEKISGDEPVTVASADTWVKYTYDLPAGTRYFAIRCVSQHQFGLMLDDISYSPQHTPVDLLGFHVYRDGTRVSGDEPLGELTWLDTHVAKDVAYTYNVTAVYDGGESVFSNDAVCTATQTTAGIAQVTATGSTVRVAGKGVVVTGAEAEVRVWDAAGRLLHAVRPQPRLALPLRHAGVYTVQVGSTVTKVVVR